MDGNLEGNITSADGIQALDHRINAWFEGDPVIVTALASLN